MPGFGRGGGRLGAEPLRRTPTNKEDLIKVKKEKLRNLGHLVTPDSKKVPTFGIMQVI